ncbi:MAG: hypothetical protein LUH15_06075 [Tannerellaceae bacterium]|nr:hypothetical protein [Tannerellaceae bacterium]
MAKRLRWMVLALFSASGGLKKEVDDPDSITGNSIELKRICFKPCPKFKAMVEEHIQFEQYK